MIYRSFDKVKINIIHGRTFWYYKYFYRLAISGDNKVDFTAVISGGHREAATSLLKMQGVWKSIEFQTRDGQQKALAIDMKNENGSIRWTIDALIEGDELICDCVAYLGGEAAPYFKDIYFKES